MDSAFSLQHSLLFLQNLQEFHNLKTFSLLINAVDVGQHIEKLWIQAGGAGRQTKASLSSALRLRTKSPKRKLNHFPRMCDLDRSQLRLITLRMNERESIQQEQLSAFIHSYGDFVLPFIPSC